MTPELRKIKDRCYIGDGAGCWIWRGAKVKSKCGNTFTPRIYAVDYTTDPSGNTKTIQTGMRAAWHALTRKPIPSGHRIFHASCKNDLCINPAHLACQSTKAWGESVRQSGNWRNVPARKIANQAINCKRAAATAEQVREIYASSETGRALSKRLGISVNVISRIKNQKTFYAQRALGNPWAGLLRVTT
jgi:hypothetical protein